MKTVEIKTKKMTYAVLLFILAIVGLNSCQTNNGFTIKGKAVGIPDQKVYLKSYALNGENASDQEILANTQIKNGEFEFSGVLENAPIELYIEFEKKITSPPNISLYQFAYDTEKSIIVDNNETIHITISLTEDQRKISTPLEGIKYSEPLIALDMKIEGILSKEYKSIIDTIEVKYGKQKKELLGKLYTLPIFEPKENWTEEVRKKHDELQVEIDKISKEQKVFKKQYIIEHPNSVISFKLFESLGLKSDEAKEMYDILSIQVKNSHIALLKKHKDDLYAQKNEQLKKTKEAVAIGNSYIDFSVEDSKGENVQFKSLVTSSNNKYILLDFWASWCAPCRAENPNLLKAYNAFKDKGFEIVALSVDTDKEKWLKAMKADNMPWIQLHDKRGFEDAAKEYGVTSIPDNFLIDCITGTIVAKNLRGEELYEKLDKLFRRFQE